MHGTMHGRQHEKMHGNKHRVMLALRMESQIYPKRYVTNNHYRKEKPEN